MYASSFVWGWLGGREGDRGGGAGQQARAVGGENTEENPLVDLHPTIMGIRLERNVQLGSSLSPPLDLWKACRRDAIVLNISGPWCYPGCIVPTSMQANEMRRRGNGQSRDRGGLFGG